MCTIYPSNYAGGTRRGGSQCILYADDTTASVTGELWPEIERKLERALNPLFKNLKENRVKVNEDKTGLMILGDRKARRMMMTMVVCIFTLQFWYITIFTDW